jgi:excisionase family DNA binding protein
MLEIQSYVRYKYIPYGHPGHDTAHSRGFTVANRVVDVEPLLTPAEVARMFRVDPKTVCRWAKTGKLNSVRTLGGHRRYREAEVRRLLKNSTYPAS